MPNYQYKAYRKNGSLVVGSVAGRSDKDALQQVHALGLIPFEAKQLDEASNATSLWRRNATSGWWRNNDTNRSRLARQLAIFLDAGVPIDQALHLIKTSERASRFTAMIVSLAEDIRSGASLSQAVANQSDVLGEDFHHATMAGELSGSLPQVLKDLADALEERAELNGRITSQLVYPVILLFMALATVVIILTVLVPSLVPMFQDTGANLPLIAQIAVTLEQISLTSMILILVALLLIAFVARHAMKYPVIRRWSERFIRRLPLLGLVVSDSEIIKVASGLALLLRNGVSLIEAIGTVGDSARSGLLRDGLAAVGEHVRVGRSLADAFADERLFDPAFIQFVRLGDSTNRLAEILQHFARLRSVALERRLERLTTLLTPALTIGIGLLVGSLILSVMQAILSMNDLVL